MSESLTLYDIETGLLDLIRQREDVMDNPELTPADQEARLKEIDLAIREYVAAEVRKVDGVAFYLREFEAREEAAKAAVTRLKARAEMWARRRERLEEVVIQVMLMMGKPKLEGDENTLAVRRNPPSADVAQLNLVPEELMRRRVTMTETLYQDIVMRPGIEGVHPPEPIKSEILKRLKAGEAIPGCRLIKANYRLEVR